MRHGHAHKRRAKQRNLEARNRWNTMQRDARAGRVAIAGAKRVLEDSLNDIRGRGIGIEGKPVRMRKAEWAQVVHPQHMIGVPMRVEHGIHRLQLLAHRLHLKILSGVDDHVVTAVRDQHRGPRTPVWRSCHIRRSTHRTGAAERRNRHGCSTSEKSERSFHT